jgi:putative peptidoglycan lipid II flippase
MSSRWSAGDVEGFRRLLSQGLRATATVLIPAALGYLVLARPIVRLLLEHGVAGPASGDLVAEVLVLFALGLFPFSAFQLLLRSSYAMQDTRTPALVNIAATALNVGANLVFVLALDLGVRGLALGHATSYVFAATALYLRVRARTGGLGGERIASSIGRALVAGVATATAAWLVAEGMGRWLGTATLGAQAAQVLSAVAAGLAVFLASAAALRIEEVDMVRQHVVGRWRR